MFESYAMASNRLQEALRKGQHTLIVFPRAAGNPVFQCTGPPLIKGTTQKTPFAEVPINYPSAAKRN